MKHPSFMIHSSPEFSLDGQPCCISGSIPSLFHIPVNTLVSSSVSGGGVAQDVLLLLLSCVIWIGNGH